MDPMMNLVVIRVSELERARLFYQAIGLHFTRERHGRGPEHLAAILGRVVFELYPRGDGPSTQGVRLGFHVASLSSALTAVSELGVHVDSGPAATALGMRAVVSDPDGHRIELIGALDPDA